MVISSFVFDEHWIVTTIMGMVIRRNNFMRSTMRSIDDCDLLIQSGAIIKWSIITGYCIQHCRG